MQPSAPWAYMMWKETRLQAAPELGAMGKEPGGNSGELSLQDPRVPDHANDEKMVCPGGEAAIGARLRPARIERSPLMQEVQELVFGQDQ